ncbi:MAG: glycosyltransferase family 4 protein [Alphaproteobacteria bacterium]|nr:glycosyltransferase family 4 protein [Alphaproteobacteria bacterium]
MARRQVLAQRLRWLAERSDWATANRLFNEIAVRAGSDPGASALLASAALRAARDAEADGRPVGAARNWVWYAAASRDTHKASRNLIRYARNLTQTRHDRKTVSNALQVWQLLAVLEPRSVEARQGLVWCRKDLAQRAEQAGDFITAQSHWSAVLDMTPNDPTAKEGLRRSLAQGALAAPDPALRSPQALSRRFKRVGTSDYAAQCATGKGLLQAGAPELAIRYVETALKERKGPEASALLFSCCVGMQRYTDAVIALSAVLETGGLDAVPEQELTKILVEAPPETFPDEALVALAREGKANELAPALAPHLVRRGLTGALRVLARNITIAALEWQPADAVAAVEFLWHSGDEQWAFRLLAVLSAIPQLAETFAGRSDSFDLERLRSVLLASPGQHFFLPGGLFVAECYQRRGDILGAVEILWRVSSNEHFAGQFPDNRDRIGRLIADLATGLASGSDPWKQLAELVSGWTSEATKAFFRGGEFERVRDAILAQRRLQNAAPSSRMGYFREHYFEHHLERRENQDPNAIASGFALCDIALQYFDAISKMRPVEEIPVSSVLKAQLGRPSLSFQEGHSADVLMSYSLLREGPKHDLRSGKLIDEAMGWYLGRFVPDSKIPSSCLSAPIQAFFNDVRYDHAALGTVATNFMWFVTPEIGDSEMRYDPANPLDALLLGLEAFASVLPSRPHYRPFFAAMFPSPDGQLSFADACVEALSEKKARGISELLSFGTTVEDRASSLSTARGAPQDVLVIGHTGAGTGLGRNFEMLTDALGGKGTKVTTIGYDLEPEAFARELRQWHAGCRNTPVVIAAINAQDVPALFIRDRHNVLDSCHIVGFFLWETSRPPRVQQLGIHLVDEIWAPTDYVARVYAPFAPVHVVGKGLFSGENLPTVGGPGRSNPLRFLTVFDFHSSIERKNPLASVLAFQRAFCAGENVELVIKASNVNPQHPGNAFGQWERLCGASAGDRRIRIITERYSEEQMERLIQAASCVVSLHRAEGFGYVLLDAMAAGIPVIATDYSGNTDFCTRETSFPVSYRLVPVRSNGAHWETDGAEWAEPDIDSATAQMLAVYEDYAAALRKAALGRDRVMAKYSKERFGTIVRERLAAMLRASGTHAAVEAQLA